MNDFDALFGEAEPDPTGQTYVQFDDDRSDDEKTETDVRNMEGRLKMSLQQMKEQVLGTVSTNIQYMHVVTNHQNYLVHLENKTIAIVKKISLRNRVR